MNWATNLLEFPVVQQIGHALLHSLWEGVAIAAMLWLVLTLFRSRGATARYLAACAAMLMMAAAPLITLLVLPATATSHATQVSDGVPRAASAGQATPMPITDRNGQRAPRIVVKSAVVERDAITPQRMSARSVNAAVAPVSAMPSQDRVSLWQRTSDWASRSAPWLALSWITGVLGMSLWNLGAWTATQRLKLSRTQPIGAEIQAIAARLSMRLDLDRAVRILQSALIDSPLVIGAIKPVILLPASILTDLPVAHLEALLAHELAHVLRHDYLVNLLQTVAESLLFYHPATWWISLRIRAERENCCDDLAIVVTRDRAAYVRALARVAGALAPTLAPAASGSELLPRLRRVLGKPDSDAAGSRWIAGALLLCVCAVMISIAASPKVAAQNAPKQSQPVPATQPAGNALKVIITAVDDASGKFLTSFRVIEGWESPGFPMFWERDRDGGTLLGKGGQFQLTETVAREGYAIRVEADGYESVRSKVFHMSDRIVRLDFRLRQLIDLEGTLVGTDGSPLAGAQVLVVTPESRVELSDGKVRDFPQALDTNSDNTGRFRLPPQSGKFLLMVVHDRGFAILSPEQLTNSHRFVVPPWASIEGTASVGTAPAVGRQIIASTHIPKQRAATEVIDPDFNHIDMLNQTKVDASGHFVVAHVPSGRVNVGITVEWGNTKDGTMRSHTQGINLSLEAGKTASIALGGKGRQVAGRVVVPASLAAKVSWNRGWFAIQSSLHFPDRTLPPNWPEMNHDQRLIWNQLWRSSPEVEAYERDVANRRFFPIVINADGTFRVDDVASGNYTLNLQAYAPFEPNVSVQTAATASLEFTVPPMPAGRSDEPLDIGAVGLTETTGAKIGEAAPALDAKTVDGTPFSLADYRGKFVLIDFWATWCGPCVEEMPYLKSTYEAFAKDSRFEIISLSLDEKVESPRQFAANQGLKWTQGFLGDWSTSDVPNKWGVQGIPALFLIGPDGKVLDTGLRGHAIQAAVTRALGAPITR